MSYTYALLTVSPETYEDLVRRLAGSGIRPDPSEDGALDLHGLAVIPENVIPENVCENGDHPAPPGVRFCSDECRLQDAGPTPGKRFRPLLDRIAVRRDEPEAVSPGGLLIPEIVRGKRNAQRGVVVAVGPGLVRPADVKLAAELDKLRADLWPHMPDALPPDGKEGRTWDLLASAAKALENPRPPGVKVGDRVLMAEWTGTEVEVDGEKLLLVREDDLLAVES